MANLTRVLGTMLATGMAGRSRRGPSFASSPFGMGGMGGMATGMSAGGRRGGMDMKQMAGLGALGYLAYKAYQDHQRNTAGQTAGSRGSGSSSGTPGGAGGGAGGGIGGMLGSILGGGQTAPGGGQAGSGGSLGERLSDMFRPQQRQEPQEPEADAYPEVAMEDQRALLLIRAMIAAANADGEISPDERQRILDKLDQAGAGPEEHRIIERELANPPSTDALVREVHDQETAEQVYLASVIAMEPDTQAERSYLQYLAARLNLNPQRAEELHDVA
ncbi:MAG TPA: tellurite resistance TerB family protein [Arenibaculum sp.]|nr:tellurite resistance TerB family protein [Arenibaculum sp.]